MKLLLTLDFPPQRGGIQQYLYGIAKHCYGAADRILIGGCSADDASVHSGVLQAAVQTGRFPGDRINKKVSLLGMVWPYLQLIRSRKQDVTVECGNVYAALVPWACRMLSRQPYRVYTYGTELLAARRAGVRAFVLRRVLAGAQTCYALGDFTISLLRDLGFTGTIERRPPRIDLPKIPPRTSQPCRAETTRIVSIGRLMPHKGHHVLIDAVARLSTPRPWRLTLIGDGPAYESLVELSGRLNIRDHVHFARNVSDRKLHRTLRESDLFVLPSIETRSGAEGFGIVLLEAMAARTPVIASASGGIAEVLDNGACGILVPPGDSLALAERLEKLRNDPKRAAQLADSAEKRLRNWYVW